jgi:hypothetical protein
VNAIGTNFIQDPLGKHEGIEDVVVKGETDGAGHKRVVGAA